MKKSNTENLEVEVSEKKYSILFESAGDGIIYLDKWGKIVDVNQKTLQIFGGSKKELLGKHFTKIGIFSPMDIPKLTSNFVNIIRGKQVTTTVNFKNKNGRMIFLECSSSIIKKDKKIISIMIIARDISERKVSEEALIESEKKYRTLVENIPQKIFFKDKNLAYISCNDNYARDLKIKPEEIVGKTDFEFYPKELAKKYRTDDKKVMKSGKVEDIEERYIQDGQERWVHTIKTVARNEKGNVVGILGVFWDITEQKRAEEKIKEFTEYLLSA